MPSRPDGCFSLQLHGLWNFTDVGLRHGMICPVLLAFSSILPCVHLSIHLFNSHLIMVYCVSITRLGLVTIYINGTDLCKINDKDLCHRCMPSAFVAPSTWLFENNGVSGIIKQVARCYENQIYGICVAQIPHFVQYF